MKNHIEGYSGYMWIYYSISGWFTLATLLVLLIKLLEPFNALLLYGKTSTDREGVSRTGLNKLVYHLVSFTVPKAYFTHFYVLFFVVNAFGIYFGIYGHIPSRWMGYIATIHHIDNDTTGIYQARFTIAALFVLQSTRRLFECVFVTKFAASSHINFLHYVAGMAFYFFISLNSLAALVSCSLLKVEPFDIFVPKFHWFCIAVFTASSFLQCLTHYHLATLKKYSLPKFSVVSSPHYLWELFIYLSVVLISISSEGVNIISINYLLAWIFVLTNLSISSLETHKYYRDKYKDKFQLRWSILPMIL